MFEQQPQDPRWNRPDDQQPAELRVGVIGCDLAIAETPPQAAQDPQPVAPEEPEQDERGREVRGDEKGDEVGVVLVDVPAEQPRQDDAMAEARDRKQLAEPLQQAEHDRLSVGDRQRSAAD